MCIEDISICRRVGAWRKDIDGWNQWLKGVILSRSGFLDIEVEGGGRDCEK